MNKHLQRGFTLIELMIVVAIVGILSSVALPAYQDYLVRARITEVIASTASMKVAVQENFAVTGRLPIEGEADTRETAISLFFSAMPTDTRSRYVDGLGMVSYDRSTESFTWMIRMSDEVGAQGEEGRPLIGMHMLAFTVMRGADGRTLTWQCDGTPRRSQMPASCRGATGSQPAPFNPFLGR